MLRSACVTIVQSGGFSHGSQIILFNQPLLNRVWRGKSPRTRTHARFPRNQKLVYEQRWRVMIWKVCAGHLVRFHSTQKCVNPSHLPERPGPQRTYWGLLSHTPDSPRSSWSPAFSDCWLRASAAQNWENKNDDAIILMPPSCDCCQSFHHYSS